MSGSPANFCSSPDGTTLSRPQAERSYRVTRFHFSGDLAGLCIFGAWLVLPFAGLEMGVLCIAFRHVQRHAADFESLAIKGDRVLVERWERGKLSRCELNRYWAQVILERSAVPGQSVLALRSHGRQVEFGQHLTEEQRQAVAQTLKQQLRNR